MKLMVYHQELKAEPETTHTNAGRVCGEIAMKVEKPDQVDGEVMNVEDLENESSVALHQQRKVDLIMKQLSWEKCHQISTLTWHNQC